MKILDKNIIPIRLSNQQISNSKFKAPEELIRWLGAIQGQDYEGAKWSLGLRLQDANISDIEKSISNRKIVHTWLMRGTLHLVSAKDIRWMLDLLSSKIITASAGRLRWFELDDNTFKKTEKILFNALSGNNELTRNEILNLLEKSNISTRNFRGIHILRKHSYDRLICHGAPQGKQQTFVLFDDWVPVSKKIDRGNAIAKLVKIYFNSRGPATLQDFVWWSGLKVSESQIGIEENSGTLFKETYNGKTYWFPKNEIFKFSNRAFLLPGFDELMLGYRDRYGSLDDIFALMICPGKNGVFYPTIICNGKIRGLWKRAFKKKMIEITATPFTKFSETEKKLITKAGNIIGKYLGLPAEVKWK